MGQAERSEKRKVISSSLSSEVISASMAKSDPSILLDIRLMEIAEDPVAFRMYLPPNLASSDKSTHDHHPECVAQGRSKLTNLGLFIESL